MTVKQYEEEDIQDALEMEKTIHEKGFKGLKKYQQYRKDRELKVGNSPMLEAREKAEEK